MTESKTKEAGKLPLTGKIFSIVSGIGFFGVLMLLSLVGAAGSRTSYAGANENTFMVVLLVTIVASMAAIRVTMRAREGGAELKTPWLIWSISVISTLLLLAKLTGLLKI